MRGRLSVLAGLIAVTAATDPTTAGAGTRSERPARAGKLVRFESCAELTRFARANVVRTGGGAGVPFRGDVLMPGGLALPPLAGGRRSGDAMPVSAPERQSPAAGGGADAQFSTTNVQEAGVDEADLIKTDGRTLYVATDGVLRVFDVTGPAPRAIGRLALGGSMHQLLLRGPRLLVLGAEEAGVVLTEVDVSTPSTPKVARTMELAGVLAGARLTGGTARVVVASTPDPIAAPTVAALRRRAASVGTRRWLPRTTIRSRISRRTFRRAVVACDDVRRPRAFSGLGLLTVLTIDLDKGLFSVDRDALMAGAQDVYASPTSLVVASRRFDPAAPENLGVAPSGGVTELHAFDAGPRPATAYRASGTVPGFLLNQFSLSEHDGVLRVATTEEAPFADGAAGDSESGVSVLRPVEGRLATVGRVTGLGRGERIYAVRFLGERGYVVTFRQVDPLYTLDLRDPTAPKVTGELKISGYSAYLHPISETLLLGVGQDATDQGRTLGTQVSLFDVGDPAAPRLVGRASLGGASSSQAEQDHHAFLWWAPANLAVLPLDRYAAAADGSDEGFSGAVGFRVAADGVAEIGRITHPAASSATGSPPIGRSVVIGDRLLTLSARGLATNRLADLAPLAFTSLE